MAVADEGGIEAEVEILHDAQAIELAVESSHLNGTRFRPHLEGDHGFHLQLKDLQAGHGVAINASNRHFTSSVRFTR